jgi:hypothetical protein
MSPAIVLTAAAAAVLVSAFTKSRRRRHAGDSAFASLILCSSLVTGLIDSSPTFAQALQKPFCMENPGGWRAGGWRSCRYESLAQCQGAAAGRSSAGNDCVPNPAQLGTNGQGGGDRRGVPSH